MYHWHKSTMPYCAPQHVLGGILRHARSIELDPDGMIISSDLATGLNRPAGLSEEFEGFADRIWIGGCMGENPQKMC